MTIYLDDIDELTFGNLFLHDEVLDSVVAPKQYMGFEYHLLVTGKVKVVEMNMRMNERSMEAFGVEEGTLNVCVVVGCLEN